MQVIEGALQVVVLIVPAEGRKRHANIPAAQANDDDDDDDDDDAVDRGAYSQGRLTPLTSNVMLRSREPRSRGSWLSGRG